MTQKNCFIAMPFGHTDQEKRWFSGWYDEVISVGVKSAGFDPILSARITAPDAINDTIREHLATDPMVLVDLGGMRPEDSSNPNVMYELGIRHAFNLPVVIMAWEGQAIPFDIHNQKVITALRGPADFSGIREKIKNFIHAAENGNYYKPMDAIKLAAQLQLAKESPNTDNLLKALIGEIQTLRNKVGVIQDKMQSNESKSPNTYSALAAALTPNVITALGFDPTISGTSHAGALMEWANANPSTFGALSADIKPSALDALTTAKVKI